MTEDQQSLCSFYGFENGTPAGQLRHGGSKTVSSTFWQAVVILLSEQESSSEISQNAGKY